MKIQVKYFTLYKIGVRDRNFYILRLELLLLNLKNHYAVVVFNIMFLFCTQFFVKNNNTIVGMIIKMIFIQVCHIQNLRT